MGVEEPLQDHRVLRRFLTKGGQGHNTPGPLARDLLQFGSYEFHDEVGLWHRLPGAGEDFVAFVVRAEFIRRPGSGEQVGQRGVDPVSGLEESLLGVAPATLGEQHDPRQGPVARLCFAPPAKPTRYGDTASSQAADQNSRRYRPAPPRGRGMPARNHRLVSIVLPS